MPTSPEPPGALSLRQGEPTVVRVHVPGAANLESARRASVLAVLLAAQLLVVKLSAADLAGVTLPGSAPGARDAAWDQEVVSRWQARRLRAGEQPLTSLIRPSSMATLLDELDEWNAQVLVLPQALAWLGSAVNRLAVGSRLPVLLARRPSPRNHLVVATDLAAGRRPIIEHAALLAHRLGASLSLVHNATPARKHAHLATASAARKRRLVSAARRLSVTPRLHLTQHSDPLLAILETAAAEDADLIVAGARAHLGPVGYRVPERLLTESDRSVLLIPPL